MGKTNNIKKEIASPTEKKEEILSKTLTPAQQIIKGYVDGAEKKEPSLQDVEITFEAGKLELEVPKQVKRKGMSYCWAAIDDLERALFQYGGKWVIVTRNNHPKVPESFFGLDGAITYKGQNILCYCRQEITEAQIEQTARTYNAKAEMEAKKNVKYSDGIYIEETEISREGGAIQQDILEQDSEVDF